MSNIQQKDLLNEGFWDNFKAKISGAGQAAAEVAKVALPQTSQNVDKMIGGTRTALKNISNASTPMTKRIQLWMDEQGKVPTSPIKLVKSFADGNKHYAVKIAEKGVKKTGETTVGRLYRDPSAIIVFNADKKMFGWVVKPRADSYLKDRNTRKIIYGDPEAEPEGSDYDGVSGNNDEDLREIAELRRLKRQRELTKLRGTP